MPPPGIEGKPKAEPPPRTARALAALAARARKEPLGIHRLGPRLDSETARGLLKTDAAGAANALLRAARPPARRGAC